MLRPVATALACASFSVVTGVSHPIPYQPVPLVTAATVTKPSPLIGRSRESDIITTASIPPRAVRPDNGVEAAARKEPNANKEDAEARGEGKTTSEPETSEEDSITSEAESIEQEAAKPPLTQAEICAVLQEAAEEHELPVPLFTRLIWQESRFRPTAVSPVGARGIAQFMPATAAERGLEDPFDPAQALPASAEFLRELVDQFGNFGLAAAAYNGGPRRVSEWLAGKGGLPKETREYVIHITGQSAEHWAEATEYGEPHPEATKVRDCKVRPIRAAFALLKTEAKSKTSKRPTWGVQLAGNWSEKKALAAYARLRKKYPQVLNQANPTVVTTKATRKGSAPKTFVRVAAESRSEAEDICKRLKEAGGSCTVQKISS